MTKIPLASKPHSSCAVYLQLAFLSPIAP